MRLPRTHTAHNGFLRSSKKRFPNGKSPNSADSAGRGNGVGGNEDQINLLQEQEVAVCPVSARVDE